jgi:hypothetical protein
MSCGCQSYSVHWIPPVGDTLAAFGCGWTGWCPDTHADHPRIGAAGEGLDVEALTREVARYGFHAELKAPFHLKNPRRMWVLESALAFTADLFRETVFRGLELAVVGGRVSLVPRERAAELDGLARWVRQTLDPLTLSLEERQEDAAPCAAGRAGQDGVAFRPAGCFHMPLTDRLPLASARQVAARLRPVVADLLEGGHVVADIALVADPGGGRARVEERYPLSEDLSRDGACACRGPRLIAPLTEEDRVGLTCA